MGLWVIAASAVMISAPVGVSALAGAFSLTTQFYIKVDKEST